MYGWTCRKYSNKTGMKAQQGYPAMEILHKKDKMKISCYRCRVAKVDLGLEKGGHCGWWKFESL